MPCRFAAVWPCRTSQRRSSGAAPPARSSGSRACATIADGTPLGPLWAGETNQGSLALRICRTIVLSWSRVDGSRELRRRARARRRCSRPVGAREREREVGVASARSQARRRSRRSVCDRLAGRGARARPPRDRPLAARWWHSDSASRRGGADDDDGGAIKASRAPRRADDDGGGRSGSSGRSRTTAARTTTASSRRGCTSTRTRS